MPPLRLATLLLPLALLSACGGMNRAVGVFPNALDDFAAVGQRDGKAPPAPADGAMPRREAR